VSIATELQFARAARELISDPERWTQRAYARNSSFICVDSSSRHACCWCSLGALRKAVAESGDGFTTLAYLENRLNKSANRLYPEQKNIISVNDTIGHAAALRVFDETISRLEREVANGNA